MKKLIFITALIAIGAAGKVHAQNAYETGAQKALSMSKTEQTFNVKESMINLRDFVDLREGKMILELSDLHDYESFRNLDSILRNFRKDVAFYKDSLAATPTAGVRIDYVVNEEYPFKKIRFKKYNSDGSIYLNQGGDISKLKFEQDTINIIMMKSKPGLGKGKCMIPYSVRATFVLGNYYDVDKIIAGGELKKIVDTLEKTSQLKKTIKNVYSHPLTIYYNPYYSGKGSYTQLPWLRNEPYLTRFSGRKRNTLSVDVNIGAGLIRNMVAPMTQEGIRYTRHTKWNHKNYDFFSVFASQYFLFEKDASGNFLVKDNWFINADVGSVYDGNEVGWLGKKVSFGVGYLVVNKGDYFKNNTFKVFTDLQVVQRFTIVPELIFTNNFKQIFPGITLKVF